MMEQNLVMMELIRLLMEQILLVRMEKNLLMEAKRLILLLMERSLLVRMEMNLPMEKNRLMEKTLRLMVMEIKKLLMETKKLLKPKTAQKMTKREKGRIKKMMLGKEE